MSGNPLHHLRITGSDIEFDCAAGDTVLRAAQRAGLGFPYECNVGSCANCKFELVEGEVRMNWEQAPGWTEKDRARKRYLGCQARPLGDCHVKLRLDPHYAPQVRPRRGPAVLLARREITADISEFRFELEQPLDFQPGQYALLYLPGVAGARAYSMSNAFIAAGDDRRIWEFQVKRVPRGQGSNTLFDQVQAGDRLEIDGPYGMAWLRRDAPRDILCLAGGSGLAPMISIARAAMNEPRLGGRRLHFVYGGRTPGDICGEDMLRVLPGWGERLHYHPAVSPPPVPTAGSPYADWGGLVGFVHDIALGLFGERLSEMEIYFAGPPAMAAAVQRMLFEARVPAAQQHFDQFY